MVINKQITVNEKQIESEDQFTYLRSIISTDNGDMKDIKARIAKSPTSLAKLQHMEI